MSATPQQVKSLVRAGKEMGYNSGLKDARKVLVRARHYQQKCAAIIVDKEGWACYEHSANVLHALCIKIGEMISSEAHMLKEKNVRK